VLDAALGEQVGLGQRVGDEVAADELDPVRHARAPDQLPAQRQGRRQVEDDGPQSRPAPAGGNG
jgi:hypothetical protein